MEIGEEIPEDHEYHKMTEPQESAQTFLEKDSHKKKLAWARSSYEKLKGMALQKEYIEREKGKILTIAMWLYCVTSLTDKLPPMKSLQKRNNGRM